MRLYWLFALCFFALWGCRDKIICPAFQSTYILDDSTRIAFFSYAWKLDEPTREEYLATIDPVADTDTLIGAMGDSPKTGLREYFTYVEKYNPPREVVKKNKFGIVKYEPYWLKNYKLKTSPMENVLGPKSEEPALDELIAVDSSAITADSTLVAVGDPLDSLTMRADSTAIAKAESEPGEKKEQRYRFRYDPKDNFNVDQDYYNKYFGVLLLDLSPEPEETPKDSIQSEEVAEQDSVAVQKSKKGLRGLFKRDKEEQPVENEEDIEEGEGN